MKNPLAVTYALFLEIVLCETFPEMELLEKGEALHGYFVRFKISAPLSKGVFSKIRDDFCAFCATPPDLKRMEMLPESATNYFNQHFPVQKVPKFHLSQDGLVGLIEYKGMLYQSSALEKSLSSADLVLFENDAEEVTIWGTFGASSKEVEQKKRYFPEGGKEALKRLGASLELWSLDQDLVWLPRGFRLKRALERLIEKEVPYWVEGFNTEDFELFVRSNHGAYFWDQIAPEEQHKNIYTSLGKRKVSGGYFGLSSELASSLISSLQFNERIIKILGLSCQICLISSKKLSKSDQGKEKFFLNACREANYSFDYQRIEERKPPSLLLVAMDSLGREWPISIWSLLERDGGFMLRHEPIRNFELLLCLVAEKNKKAFPLSVAPEQVCLIPVAEKNLPRAELIKQALLDRGIEVALDLNFQRLQNRVLRSERLKTPFVAILGDQEEAKDCLAVRGCGEKKTHFLSVEGIVALIKEKIEKELNAVKG